tara:strand:- start:234 stop:467 length:234 start_codon:yes stop_codon:yes gene_type:complete
MNSNEEKINSQEINEKDANSKEYNTDEKSLDTEEIYKFGWGSYSEITNGRFAMLGFLAIIVIELLSKQSFLKWAGIL